MFERDPDQRDVPADHTAYLVRTWANPRAFEILSPLPSDDRS
jgi:hypothetical protein